MANPSADQKFRAIYWPPHHTWHIEVRRWYGWKWIATEHSEESAQKRLDQIARSKTLYPSTCV